MRIYQFCWAALFAALFGVTIVPAATAQDTAVKPIEIKETVAEPIEVVEPTARELQPVAVSQAGVQQVAAPAEQSFHDQISQLQSRLAALESQSNAKSDCCPIPSRRIATNSLRSPRHYAGVELALLKAHTGSISGSIFGASGTLTPEYDYEVAPRVFIGRERCDGLGFRASYFQFHQGTDDVGLGGTTTSLEIHALDLELTNRVEFCGSDLTLSAGLRYGDLSSAINAPGLGGDILTFESDGVGPTISAAIRRDLGRTHWDLVAGARGSLLLTDATMGIPGFLAVNADDSTLQIWEARIGVQRTRQLSGGKQLVTQFAFEAQNWQSGSILGLISPDFALAGPTFQVGLNF